MIISLSGSFSLLLHTHTHCYVLLFAPTLLNMYRQKLGSTPWNKNLP